jgi:hypothetical protein
MGSKPVQNEYEGGFMMAARRLQALFRTAQRDNESSRRERKEEEDKRRRDEQLRSRWFGAVVTAERFEKENEERRLAEEKREKERKEAARMWKDAVYNNRGGPIASSSVATASGVTSAVPSTHRRASEPDPAARAARAPGAPSRTQSALEIYAKYPLFARSSSKGAGPSVGSGLKNPCKSSASLATSASTAFGISASPSNSLASNSNIRSSTGKSTSSSMDASTLPGVVDPEMYKGKRLAGSRPRRLIAEGVEGKLLIPAVLLKPIQPSSSGQLCSSLPNSGLVPRPGDGDVNGGMKRSESEANVVRRAGSVSASTRSRSGKGKGKRSESALGAVKEEAVSTSEVRAEAKGEWHRPEASETSSVSGSSSSGMRVKGRRRGSASEKYSKSSSYHVYEALSY